MDTEYFSLSKGKVILIINENKDNITVTFGKGETHSFLKIDPFELERYESHRQPDDDNFFRDFLFDGEGTVMWVKKTCKSNLSEDEKELVEWYEQEQEYRLVRLAQPFNYEKDEDDMF